MELLINVSTKVTLWVIFFPLGLQKKIFNPTMQICLLDGIVGVTSLYPILMPLVQSFGDLSLKRAFSCCFLV
jgi:hypothetical protein